MPRVGWQPCSNTDHQNGSKVTNSSTCLGRGWGKGDPRNMNVEELAGGWSLRPLPYPGLERFHLCFRFKIRVFTELGQTREGMDRVAPSVPSSLRQEKTSNSGHEASAFGRCSSPPRQGPENQWPWRCLEMSLKSMMPFLMTLWGSSGS